MNFIEKLKGVFRRMFSSESLNKTINLQPIISAPMKDAIELWEMMYKDESPWLYEDNNLKSLGLASMIASAKARTATIEMELKVTGEGERRDLIEDFLRTKIELSIRKQLEYGIALGGIVFKPYVYKVGGKYKVGMNYVKATDFYPLAFNSEGDVIDAAFIDRIVTKDTIYSKVERYHLIDNTLYVSNMAFKQQNRDSDTTIHNSPTLGEPIPLSSVPEWSSIDAEAVINDTDNIMFAYFKMPQANTVDLNSPLGVSGFSKATDLIKHADELYSDLLWEFEGGQLAVDVDRTAVNPLLDNNGNMANLLPHLQDRLFRRNLDLGDEAAYNVFSPELRDTSIINGLNNVLMHIEDICDLGRGELSMVTYQEARTATELKILKQRSYSANWDVQKELEKALRKTVDIVNKYCDLYNITPSGKFEVAYKWDDSILVDAEAERNSDVIDITNGLMSRVEYRMKWFGETKEQAIQSIKEIDEEKLTQMEQQQEMFAQFDTKQTDEGTPNNKDGSADKSNKDTTQYTKSKDK
jgi:A118 family predicted phage portal protein